MGLLKVSKTNVSNGISDFIISKFGTLVTSKFMCTFTDTNMGAGDLGRSLSIPVPGSCSFSMMNFKDLFKDQIHFLKDLSQSLIFVFCINKDYCDSFWSKV